MYKEWRLMSEQNPIPEWDMSLMHTHFRKEPFAVKEFGKKVVDQELPHRSEIGKNPSICKKLWHLGGILNGLGIGFAFNDLDNHVWLAQMNLKDRKKIIHICFNCGSLKIDGKFIPYTDLKK
jgi:hypothetical protein